MKRTVRGLSLFIAVVLMLSLAACGGTNGNAPTNGDNDMSTPQQTTQSETAPTPEVTPESAPETGQNSETGGNSLQGGLNQRLPLEVIETGYGFATWNESSLSYGIVLYNPNNEALEFPSFRITARRENNSIIDTEDKTLNIIYPGQTLTIADIAFTVVPDEVHSVEFELLEPSDRNWTTGEFIEFEAINLHLGNAERGGYSVTGEISNPNDRAFDSVRLDMLLRDSSGHIVGGDFTFIDNLSAKGTVPFQIDVRDSILKNIEGEWEVEIHASPW